MIESLEEPELARSLLHLEAVLPVPGGQPIADLLLLTQPVRLKLGQPALRLQLILPEGDATRRAGKHGEQGTIRGGESQDGLGGQLWRSTVADLKGDSERSCAASRRGEDVFGEAERPGAEVKVEHVWVGAGQDAILELAIGTGVGVNRVDFENEVTWTT